MNLQRLDDWVEGIAIVADLQADLEFKTLTSAGFRLHQDGYDRGWVEIHHPCDGHIKARVRGELRPSRAPNLDRAMARLIVDKLLLAVEIPQDETYAAVFASLADGVLHLEQRVDREGLTDVIDFVRKPK